MAEDKLKVTRPSPAACGAIFLITFYRYLFSCLFGNVCRFYPSCSAYAIEALRTHGIFTGSYLTLKRLLRCHPWQKGGCDPVPSGVKNSCSTLY